MAGDITQDAVTLALGGAAIGVTGAVAAQIVAAIFTGKLEKKKAIADDDGGSWRATPSVETGISIKRLISSAASYPF